MYLCLFCFLRFLLSSHGTLSLKKVSRPEKQGILAQFSFRSEYRTQKSSSNAYFLWGTIGEWILLEVLPRIDGKAKIWVAFTSLLCLWVEAVIDLWLLKDFYSLENVQKKPMKQKKVHLTTFQIGLSKNHHFTVVLEKQPKCVSL